MPRLVVIGILFGSLLLIASTGVGQEKTKDKSSDADASPNKATPADYRKLASIGSYTGKVSMGGKTVSFKIDDADYRKALKNAAKAKTPAEQKAATAQVERQFAALKWALGKEFVLDLEPKATLRKLHAPTVEFDSKGFPKTTKLTGPPYPATPEDFGGDYMTKIEFGALKNGKPTVRSALVDNKQW
jgi:hypothetical protein